MGEGKWERLQLKTLRDQAARRSATRVAGRCCTPSVDALESRRFFSTTIGHATQVHQLSRGEHRDIGTFADDSDTTAPDESGPVAPELVRPTATGNVDWLRVDGSEPTSHMDLAGNDQGVVEHHSDRVAAFLVNEADALIASVDWAGLTSRISCDGHAQPMNVEADPHSASSHASPAGDTSSTAPESGAIDSAPSASDCPTVGPSAPVNGSGAASSAAASDPTLSTSSDLPPAPLPVMMMHPRPARVSADDVHVASAQSQQPAVPGGVITSLGHKTAADSTATQSSTSTASTASSSVATILVSTGAVAARTAAPLTALLPVRSSRFIDSSTLFSAAEIAASPAAVAVAAAPDMAQAVRAARAALSQLPQLAAQSLHEVAAASPVADPAPLVGRVVYNLIHLDALGAFSDSTARFISESLMLGSRRSWSRSRAWFITSVVVAGDAVLVGYLLRTRRDEKAHLASQPAPPPQLSRQRRHRLVPQAEREFAADAR